MFFMLLRVSALFKKGCLSRLSAVVRSAGFVLRQVVANWRNSGDQWEAGSMTDADVMPRPVLSIALSSSRGYGMLPTAISSRRIPTLHRSQAQPWRFPRIISGAIQCADPTMDTGRWLTSIASPKSMSFTSPSTLIMMLGDFKSRCAYPRLCMYANAFKISLVTYAIWPSLNSDDVTASCNVPPSMYSMVIHTSSPSSYAALYVTMFGWRRVCRNQISSSTARRLRSWKFTFLSATRPLSPGMLDLATDTVPNPPLPDDS
mmetsp:Transcript_32025/g.80349  ORF Transcript_32025/g.80349 Transcript_32025/m.80349 type:complete len:260 (-) Transcript_32025:2424-3203(-)